MPQIQITGRRSSHFTRVPLIFAHELGLDIELKPVFDLTVLGAEEYAQNPALKIPTLRRGDVVVFGAENICRVLCERVAKAPRVVWPEELREPVSRNAQELVWHAMSAEVQLVMGTLVSQLPADDVFFVKCRAGLEGALQWLDTHLVDVVRTLPSDRSVSLFEVTLFCLLEHLRFRGTSSFDHQPALVRFVEAYGTRQSSIDTAYRFDGPFSR